MPKSRARVFADFISGNNVAQIEYIASQANNLTLSITDRIQKSNAYANFVSNTNFQSFVANTNQYIGLVGGAQYIQLTQDGRLSPTVGVAKWYAPAPLVVTGITSRVGETSLGQPITVVINTNGNESTTTRLAPQTTTLSNTTNFNMATGDFLTADIQTIGTERAGSDLSIQVTFSYNE